MNREIDRKTESRHRVENGSGVSKCFFVVSHESILTLARERPLRS
jgi:hypothetical protein